MSANAFRRQTDYQKALFLYWHIFLRFQFFSWHSWQRAGAPFGPFCTNLAPAAGAMPSLGASQHPKMSSGGCSGGDLLHNFQTRLPGRLTPPSCGHFLGAASPLAGGVPLPPSGRSLLGTAAPPPPDSEAQKPLQKPLPEAKFARALCISTRWGVKVESSGVEKEFGVPVDAGERGSARCPCCKGVLVSWVRGQSQALPPSATW